MKRTFSSNYLSKKQKDLEEKDATKRAKAAEKAALLAEEEASLSTIAKSKPTKKKGKDDFDLLNGTLSCRIKMLSISIFCK